MKKILCICLSATYQRSITFNTVNLEQVNRSEKYVLHASGKAVNSARVLAQLEEGTPITVCPLGQENQTEFIKLAEKDKLNLNYITVPGKIRECWTLLDKTNNTTTELVVGENANWTSEISAAVEIKLLKMITELLPQVDAVLLAGSKQGCWNDDLYSTIAGICEDAGKLFLADYIGNELIRTIETCHNIIIKVNEEEFCTTFLTTNELQIYNNLSKNEREHKLQQLIIDKSKQYQNIIVVTRGKDTTFAAQNGNFSQCATEELTPVNTTACGDSFNAGFLYHFIKTGDLEGALKKGTWCAARNAQVETPGAIQ